MKLKDEVGNRYGRLLVIGRAENCKQGQAQWKCLCDCGNTCTVTGSNLRRGKQISCGCYGHQVNAKNDVPTELRQGRIYRIWQRMISRCANPQNSRYYTYGARGIAVCEEWANDYIEFHKWAIANGYKENLSIDRINIDGNYEPSNCRWATPKQQGRNTTRTVYLTYNGEKRPLTEWCEIFNLKRSTVYARLHDRKWSDPQEILFGRKRKAGNVYG